MSPRGPRSSCPRARHGRSWTNSKTLHRRRWTPPRLRRGCWRSASRALRATAIRRSTSPTTLSKRSRGGKRPSSRAGYKSSKSLIAAFGTFETSANICSIDNFRTSDIIPHDAPSHCTYLLDSISLDHHPCAMPLMTSSATLGPEQDQMALSFRACRGLRLLPQSNGLLRGAPPPPPNGASLTTRLQSSLYRKRIVTMSDAVR
jgi:hypothetical protein